MTSDEILEGITEPIYNRNDVAAVIWLFRSIKEKLKLMLVGKHLNDEKDQWDAGDLNVLRKEFKTCLGNLQ